jgi:hypothetical protein
MEDTPIEICKTCQYYPYCRENELDGVFIGEGKKCEQEELTITIKLLKVVIESLEKIGKDAISNNEPILSSLIGHNVSKLNKILKELKDDKINGK